MKALAVALFILFWPMLRCIAVYLDVRNKSIRDFRLIGLAAVIDLALWILVPVVIYFKF